MEEPVGIDDPDPVKKVLKVLKDQNVLYLIQTFDRPAHRATEAADLLGCPLGAVVKSLVFINQNTEKMVLALVSGQNRVGIDALSRIIGNPVRTATAEEVVALTGYNVGAVPPVGISGEFPVIMDRDLKAYTYVWAAAGISNSLIRITPADLVHLSQCQVEEIKAV